MGDRRGPGLKERQHVLQFLPIAEAAAPGHAKASQCWLLQQASGHREAHHQVQRQDARAQRLLDLPWVETDRWEWAPTLRQASAICWNSLRPGQVVHVCVSLNVAHSRPLLHCVTACPATDQNQVTSIASMSNVNKIVSEQEHLCLKG